MISYYSEVNNNLLPHDREILLCFEEVSELKINLKKSETIRVRRVDGIKRLTNQL